MQQSLTRKEKFRILLISPPVFDFYYTPARAEPLGLLYLKGALDRFDFTETEILDCQARHRSKKIAWPESFDYLKKYYTSDNSPWSLFQSYHRFGDSFNSIIDKINQHDYDLVGVSALFSGYFPDVEELIKRIKQETKSLVVAGGWAVSAEEASLFKESAADFFIPGSGEESITKLATALFHNKSFSDVPGLIWRNNKDIVCNQKSSEPIPEFIPPRTASYFFKGKRIAKMTVSRGCTNRCSFCSIHQIQCYSRRSIESIEEELKFLLSTGIEIVNFEDDNLFSDTDFNIQFIPLLKKYHDSGLSYAAMNGLTASTLTSIVEDLIDAGFIEFNLSLVTAKRSSAENSRRPFYIETLSDIVRQINGRVPTLVFLILGLPDTEPAQVLQDIVMLSELPVIIGVSPLYLLPGIAYLEKIGMPADRRMLRGTALHKFDPAFSRDDVISLWKVTRMINYLKSAENPSDKEILDNIEYFQKSIIEGRWYRHNDNKWLDGSICTIKEEALRQLSFININSE